MTARSTSSEVRLGELADEFIERLRRGEQPLIEPYAGKYPDIADEIRELFPTLVSMEQVSLGDCSDDAPSEPLPERLGEYRIVRKLGHGGMGIVYEAEQESLGRFVALKVLPQGTIAGARNLTRFQFEARAAAKLRHPNIVPVFGFGHDQGIHYYVMQFIPGQGLDLILDELREMKASHRRGNATLSAIPDPLGVAGLDDDSEAETNASVQPRDASGSENTTTSSLGLASTSSLTRRLHYFHRIARIGADVADALAYAHDEGVLHRDIKPSNLLLDSDGTIWVTDFGLAKTTAGDLTHSGELIGTLRYMAPERLDGGSEPRSDVYSLGLTLYEMLTLRPAFLTHERAELIRQIAQCQPIRPRKIDRSIPRDLETIILKAIEKSAAARYATASDLASDLGRFLAGKPIVARRTSVRERTWMWCRRNPLPATLTAGLAVMLVILGIGYSIHVTTLNLALDRAVKAERRERSANQTARQRLFESYVSEATSVRRGGVPGNRTRSLKAVANASEMLHDVKLDDPTEFEMVLRNEAIAAMARIDLRWDQTWSMADGRETVSHPRWCFDSGIETYVHGTADGDVVIRALDDNRIIKKFDRVNPIPPPTQRHYFCFSPNDRYVAQYTADKQDRKFIFLIDLEKDCVLTEDPFQSSGSMSWKPICFGPASEHFYFLDVNGHLVCYEIAKGTQRVVRKEANCVHVAVSPDGCAVALTRGDQSIEVLALPDGEPLLEIESPSVVFDIAWSANSRLLAAGCEHRCVYLWDINASDEPISRCVGHSGKIRQIRFSPTGLLATSSWDETTRIWDPLIGKELIRIEGFANIQFSRDGKWMGIARAGGDVSRAEIVGRNECLILNSSSSQQRSWTEAISFSDDGRLLVSASSKDGIRIWDTLDGACVSKFRPYPTTKSVAFTADDKYLVTSGSSRLDRWELLEAGGTVKVVLGPRETLFEPKDAVNAVFDVSRNGRILTSERFEGFAALEAGSHESLGSFDNDDWVNHLSISPDGKWAACGAWHTPFCKVWNLVTGELVFRYRLPTLGSVPKFSPDGKWLAICGDSRIVFVSVGTWKQTLTYDRDDTGFAKIAFAPDMKTVAVSRIFSVELHAFPSLELLASLRGPNGSQIAAAHPDASPLSFGPNGKMLAVGTYQDSVLLWKLDRVRAQLRKMGLDWNDDDQPASPRSVASEN